LRYLIQPKNPNKTHQRRVALVTLGCPKNEVDSEVLAGQLRDDGFLLCPEPEEADIILVNTCGFIESAKQESIEAILDLLRLKETDQNPEIYVWGCLAERYKEELPQEIPEADGFFGVEAFDQIRSRLNHRRKDLSDATPGSRVLSTPSHTAYLKIAEGCSHQCSFCAIPLFKGKYRSRPIVDLVHEAQALADQGVRELSLIAQDTTAYGTDFNDGTRLSDLLRDLVQIDGIEWIRILYAHPSHIEDDLIQIILEEEKICNYLDMPLQHIHTPILKQMGRGMRREEIEGLIRKLREKIPNITLRTAFIVGFPGETDEAFEELLQFIQATRFERLGAFTYSPEEGTPAFEFGPIPPKNIAEARYDQIMQTQQEISLELNEAFIGKTLPVLIDEYDPAQKMYAGRTRGDAIEIDQTVWVQGECSIGEIVPVQITDADVYDLIGVLNPS